MGLVSQFNRYLPEAFTHAFYTEKGQSNVSALTSLNSLLPRITAFYQYQAVIFTLVG